MKNRTPGECLTSVNEPIATRNRTLEEVRRGRGTVLRNTPLYLVGLLSAVLLGACASAQNATSSTRSLAHKAIHPERFIGESEEPPPQLGIKASDARIAAVIDHWIIPDGPGAWVRSAKWDEVVLTLTNKSQVPVRITAARLIDPRGTSIASGDDPPEIESRTDRLIGEYEDVGFSVAIVAAPAAVYGAAALAGSVAAGAGLAAGTAATGVAAGTVATGGVGVLGAGSVAAVAAPLVVPAAIVAAPVYYFWRKHVKGQDLENIRDELLQRQLPVDLAPGASLHGSQFFPIVPNPRALALDYSQGGNDFTLEVPLDRLAGLHVAGPAASGESQ